MGGRSRRMGTGIDKAYLPAPDTGQPSWERQAGLLEKLNPQARFLSLRPGQSAPPLPATWRVIVDEIADTGPIGGIAACLAALQTDLLLVLAIDLLGMQPRPLQDLMAHAESGRGAVFQQDGFYEPLIAVYPKAAATSAAGFLHQGGRRLQPWLCTLKDEGMINVLPVRKAFSGYFVNVNDVEAYTELSQNHEPG